MDTIGPIITAILKDHGGGVTAVLLLVLLGLGWLYKNTANQSKKDLDNLIKMFQTHIKDDRQELIKMFQTQIEAERKELMEIIDKYHQGQISVVQAINEIKLLIVTIGTKL